MRPPIARLTQAVAAAGVILALTVAAPSAVAQAPGSRWIFKPSPDGSIQTLYPRACLPIALSSRIAAATRLEGDVLGLAVTFTIEQLAASGRFIGRVTLADGQRDSGRDAQPAGATR